MQWEQLRDFAEEHIFDDVDDPAAPPFSKDSFFQLIADECQMQVEDSTRKEELWQLVLKSRQDVGCATTALEDIATQYENENKLTVSSLVLPEVGKPLVCAFETNMATWLTSEQVKWKRAYAKLFADKFLGVAIDYSSSEEENEEPPSESDEDENEGEPDEDLDYESDGEAPSDSDEDRDPKRQKPDSDED